MESLPTDQDQDEIIIKCSLDKITEAFFKDYEIIWHDPNVNSQENQQYMEELEKLCKVKTFTEWKEAENHIKAAKTICHVITSGTNGELFVKEIFSSANVPKIFTFCRAKDYHSTWAKDYEKILCTETKIEDVIYQIQKNLQEWHKQSSSLKLDLPAFAPIFDDWDKSEMNNLHHYLKVVPNFTNRAQAKQDFVNLSKGIYTDEENKQLIARFEKTYDEYNMEATLKWYTRQSFLYKAINNCLRIATSDSIQYCRLLLKDVEKAIQDQYQKKSKNFSGLFYRGAYLSEEEWSNLKANVNREIEMHGFLSVSKEKKVALNFVRGDPSKKVFITIIVPKGPCEEEQGFAEIEEFSDFPNEKEVLFNVRSKFTVLETEDGGSKASPYRHLVLLYGAQSLRKFIAEEDPALQVEIGEAETIICSGCQALVAEMTEKMFFVPLANLEGKIYCRNCLGNDATAPFLCVPVPEVAVYEIPGCILINSSQTQIPLYGYKCSKCGVKKQKRYFVCTDCGDREKRWCQSCFGNTLSCMEAEHAIILESYPFSFWCEKMSENELRHEKFQNDLAKESKHAFPQQAKMYFTTHEYEKALEYFHLVLQQNEIKIKSDSEPLPDVATTYSNIGVVYEAQGEYSKALEYHLKSLDIRVHEENDDDVATSCKNIGSVYERQGEYEKALECHLKSLKILKSLHGEVHADVAILYGNIGLVYQNQGEYNKALEYYLESLNIGKTVHGENHPEIANYYNNIGLIYNKQGEYNKALEHYFKSVDIRKIVHGENDPRVANSYNNIGSVYEVQGEYTKALEYLLKSLKILKSIHRDNHPDIATAENNIGSIYEKQGEYEKALEYHLKSLETFKSVHGENHPSVATSYGNIGTVYKRQGEYKEALEYCLKCLEIFKSVHGENHPEIATSYGNIGIVYKSQGEYKEALEYYLKSLEILKSLYEENHPDIASIYDNIGAVYHIQGEYSQALEYHLKSLGIRKIVYGENHPHIAISYNNIGTIHQDQKEYKKALEYYLKSLNIGKIVHGENHPEIANSYNNVGLLYDGQGEYEKALEYHLKSLEIYKSIHQENHPDIASTCNNIGSVYEKQGEFEKALEYYFQSLNIFKSVHGENHQSVTGCYCKIAEVYTNQGESKKALEYSLKSLGINFSVDEVNDPEKKAFLIELLQSRMTQDDTQS